MSERAEPIADQFAQANAGLIETDAGRLRQSSGISQPSRIRGGTDWLGSCRSVVGVHAGKGARRARHYPIEPLLEDGQGVHYYLFERRVLGTGERAAEEGLSTEIEKGHEVLVGSQIVHRRLDVRAGDVERAGSKNRCRFLEQPLDCRTPCRRVFTKGTAVWLVPGDRRARLSEVRRNAHAATVARVGGLCEGGNRAFTAVFGEK